MRVRRELERFGFDQFERLRPSGCGRFAMGGDMCAGRGAPLDAARVICGQSAKGLPHIVRYVRRFSARLGKFFCGRIGYVLK